MAYVASPAHLSDLACDTLPSALSAPATLASVYSSSPAGSGTYRDGSGAYTRNHWSIIFIIMLLKIYIPYTSLFLSSSMRFHTCIDSCHHHHIAGNIKHSKIQWRSLMLSFRSQFLLSPPATTDLFSAPIVSFFINRRLNGIIQCIIFGDWLLSLNIKHLGFIHIAVCIGSPFVFTAEWYSIGWMRHSLFVHLFDETHLGSFQFGAIMNNATINICVQVFVWVWVFIYNK